MYEQTTEWAERVREMDADPTETELGAQ